MRRLIFFIFFIGCNVNSSMAQTQGYEYSDSSLLDNTESTPNNIARTDTILFIHDIIIPVDTIKAWKTDKRFNYVKDLDSLLQAGEKETQDEYNATSKKAAPSILQRILSSGFVQFIFWMIAAVVVLFILYKLFLNKGLFKRKSASLSVKEVGAEQQNIIDDAADYDALIRQSFRLADYRIAVRYLFLKTLRQLSDKDLLQRSGDKTNFQYVQEINADKKKEFASLVLNYEYVWYGHMDITREQFERIEKTYTSFYNKI